jgi:signal transduction histidine kinase
MLTRRRWSAFGLRGRIVGAVLVTTVATLAVAALGLFPQLETALRHASRTTLKNDVRKASASIRSLARIPYPIIAELNDPAFLQADPAAATAARAVLHTLDAERTSLQTRLGATTVFLIGYVDGSGHGQPLSQSGAASSPADALQDASFPDVASAFRTGATKYSFATIGSHQFVRAAIPLRGDDAVLAVYKSIDEIPDAVAVVRRAVAIAALAGLVLTLLLAIPLAATLVRRLQRLRQAALRIAVEGAVAEVPDDPSRDEIGDLARSFAIMQRRLRHQEDARRQFVATASHELRTPLASLDGMLELLADDLRSGAVDLDDAMALLERARSQSRRLGRLAADLLDLSRIDADVALRSEPIELAELSRAVLAEFEIASAERGVTVALHEAPGAVWALGDPGSVARILRILLDNALRVAPRGSEVSVVLRGAPAPALSVVDRGPGVPPEERRLIFQRFQRGRDTGGEAGFGLGLAIGRELAERMGGHLVLEDAAAPGATFTLTLRTARAPLEEPAEPAATHS